MGETLSMVLGTDRAFQMQCADSFGNPIGLLPSGQPAFLATDALQARVWPGDDLPTLFAPTAAWTIPTGLLQPTTGQYTLTVAAAQTAGLAAGRYRLQVLVTRGAQSVPAFDGSLELTTAPGTGVAPPVYGPFDDLLLYAPWLEQLQADHDETGFLSQRGRARSWLDEAVLSRWKGSIWFPLSSSTYPGPAAWNIYGLGIDPGPSKWLRDQLALNTLIIRDTTREMIAKKAIAYVCAGQLGKAEGTPYQTLATWFHREANALARSYRAEIDLNGDGYADIIVNLGYTNLR